MHTIYAYNSAAPPTPDPDRTERALNPYHLQHAPPDNNTTNPTMALRLTTARFAPRLTAGISRAAGTRPLSSAVPSTDSAGIPSVKDVMIKLTLVDPSGARRSVPGLVGKNLHEICEMHGIDIGPSSSGGAVSAIRSSTWEEPLYGEGPSSGFDHVLLVGNGAETAAPINHDETRMLEHYWDDDEIFPESRLASCVTLTKHMDGMTVYVPDRICDDIP